MELRMSLNDKPLIWLQAEVKSPPFSVAARVEIGYQLRRVQQGEKLRMPLSRPMAAIGKRCHELRVTDEKVTWRLIYRVDHDAIVLVKVFNKKTTRTPKQVIDVCKARLKDYDDA